MIATGKEPNTMSNDSGSQTGSAGRFGARYGRVSRKRVADIERMMRRDHACPECGEDEVSREGTGVWACSSCGHQFAGGAFVPQTPAGMEGQRSIEAALSEQAADETEE